LFRAGLLIPPLLSSRLSESASDAVFDLIDALNSAISFVPRIFRDPVHFPFFLPRIEFILTTEISHSQVIEGQERENQVGCGDVRICTYLYLFSDQFGSVFSLTQS